MEIIYIMNKLSKIVEEITEDKVEELVQIVVRQTDYSAEVAREKLTDLDYDHIKVIKQFFGIPEKKEPIIKSVNQEIYRQLRSKMQIPASKLAEMDAKVSNSNV